MKYFDSGNDLEFVLTEKTNITFEKHNHISKYVAGLILNGSLNVVEDTNTVKCKCDDIFIIPIYSAHSLYIKDKATRILTMCVGCKFLGKHLEDNEERLLTHYTNELQAQNIINEKQAIAFHDAMDIIIKLYREQEIAFPEQINKINQVIINGPEKKIEIECLAKQIYISKYYLIRKFKENIGLTPHNFQIQNRIRKSQHLLAKGVTIADIAAELGFYDQSHFIKAFKSILGITPSEYINSLEKLE